MDRIRVGGRVPATPLGELLDGGVKTVWPNHEFANQRVVLVGVPGAFAPICSRAHLPGFVQRVPALKRSGFDQVICVAPNTPWALAAWSQQLDPERRMRFLSDGNLKFGRATGLTTRQDAFFMGECLERFVMVLRDGFVEKLSVEASSEDVTCTAASEVTLA